MTHRARPFCFIVNERRFRPTTSTHIQLRVIFEHCDQQAASGGESSQVQHRTDEVGRAKARGAGIIDKSVVRSRIQSRLSVLFQGQCFHSKERLSLIDVKQQVESANSQCMAGLNPSRCCCLLEIPLRQQIGIQVCSALRIRRVVAFPSLRLIGVSVPMLCV